MKKVLGLMAVFALAACSSSPSNSQLATDCTNGPLAAMCPGYTATTCSNYNPSTTVDAGAACTNASAMATATDNCLTAVHTSSDCTTLTTCLMNVPTCTH